LPYSHACPSVYPAEGAEKADLSEKSRKMSGSVRKKLLWALIASGLFAFFYWIFGLGLPGAAFEFAGGTTLIILSGLLLGNYAARLWYKSSSHTFNTLLGSLTALALACLLLIGWLVNKMIGHTQFSYFFFTVVTLFLMSAAVAAIVSLVRNRIKNKLRSAHTALAHSKTELQLLQSQVSPHFLFNTLNNLYGLSLSEHEKVPGLLLKLSDLLRYSVYEAKEAFVPLADEVNYLNNYIAFEKIRLGKRLSLTAELPQVGDPSIRIAPMLLIVFVENAFKHAKNNSDEHIFIRITLQANPASLFFSVENSYSPPVALPAFPKSHSGFGLESVKKRLALLYDDVHDLRITQAERTYSVTLLLKQT
jgi:sensor histidine kinase YesM